MRAAEAFVNAHPSFVLHDNLWQRVHISGKRFWVWDLRSAEGYVATARFQQAEGRRCSCLKENVQLHDHDAALDMVYVLVPAIIAQRVHDIATALLNLMVICSLASYPFENLLSAANSLKRQLDPDIYKMLRRQGDVAKSAKHDALVLAHGTAPLAGGAALGRDL